MELNVEKMYINIPRLVCSRISIVKLDVIKRINVATKGYKIPSKSCNIWPVIIFIASHRPKKEGNFQEKVNRLL